MHKIKNKNKQMKCVYEYMCINMSRNKVCLLYVCMYMHVYICHFGWQFAFYCLVDTSTNQCEHLAGTMQLGPTWSAIIYKLADIARDKCLNSLTDPTVAVVVILAASNYAAVGAP